MDRFYLGQVMLVGLGGFCGSSTRFMLSGLVHRGQALSSFPFGTLVVNVAGCLAIGLLGGLMEAKQVLTPPQRLFLMIGFLGGFTTFSTFAYESLNLAHASEFGKSLVNVGAHVVLCLAAVWLGDLCARSL